MLQTLERYRIDCEVVDPCVNAKESKSEFNLDVQELIPFGKKFNAVILAVGHRQFREIQSQQWEELLVPDGVLVDLVGTIPRELSAIRL